jgi:polysaccharide biosynthesis/export protein
MEKMMLRWRNQRSLSLVVGALALAVPAWAQQSMLPNLNGGNSTFNGDPQSRPANGASSGSLTAIPDDFPNLRLTPGILLNMTIYDEPELTTAARVDDEGDVTLPLIGAIHVGGDTVAAAQKKVQDKYRAAQILKDPQVILNVVQYPNGNVMVLGEVQTPGRFPILAPHSLLDVIAMAGGETKLASDTIQVEGSDKNGHALRTYHYVPGEDEGALQKAMVDPGDTVRVLRAGIVYVLGAVYRPGGYVMQENGSLNVAQAVSLAQGTLLQAKVGGMRVIRREPDGTLKEIPIQYSKIMQGKNSPLELEAQDIVYVPVSKVKSVFTGGANIVGETSSAAIYAVR